MLDIKCCVGRFRPEIDLQFPLEINGRTIPEHFGLGSIKETGSSAIRMRMDFSRMNESIAGSGQFTTAIALHQALARLTQNSPNANSITNIGLILADRFEFRKRLLGVMFDFGFNPSGMDAVSSRFTNVPREGCAIFLDAIRDIRPILSDFRQEVVFTAIHELGHVFNLWHLESPISFMSSSEVEAPFSPGACFFHSSQRAFLNRAEFDEHVQPGGSLFERRGAFGPAANDPFKHHPKHNLQLQITASQKEFWFFEPIELDVRLSSKHGQFELPDEIDPGYDRFVIHITRPDGTRFKYRSPRIYCCNLSTLMVAPRKPFIRDISIFGQSGGYTFESPGEYKIQCVFDTGKGFSIASNILSVNVERSLFTNKRYKNLYEILTHKGTALLLYHRNGNFRSETVKQLEEVAMKEKRSTLGANLMYALAKYKGSKTRMLNNTKIRQMDKMINVALDSGRLGEARMKNLSSLKERFKL